MKGLLTSLKRLRFLSAASGGKSRVERVIREGLDSTPLFMEDCEETSLDKG